MSDTIHPDTIRLNRAQETSGSRLGIRTINDGLFKAKSAIRIFFLHTIDIKMSKTEETDVLIIGGGPVGLLTAYSLARQGVSSIVVGE